MTTIIQTTTHPHSTYFLSTSNKNQCFLYIEWKAGTSPKAKERLPLNLALVIDRSGSMRGDKLHYAKKATDFVIDNLSEKDSLSIVQYDNTVEVLSPSKAVSNKHHLHALVRNIAARGSTNLSGGMLEGFNQNNTTKKENQVNRVLLLSDGLANVGIMDNEGLKDLAQKKYRALGIGLSSFGIGADFNEELMTHISEYGGGNYYFIDNADKIPEIFAQELDGLLSVVAQNGKAEVEFPHHAFQVEKVYGGYPYTTSGDKLNINFNDVFSEEKKAVLIEFKIKEPLDSNINFKIKHSWDNASSFDREVKEHALEILLTDNAALCDEGVNATVAQNIALFTANDWYEQAIKLTEQYRIDEAKTLLTKAISSLEMALKLFPGSEELKIQLDQIKQFESRLGDVQRMSRMERSKYYKVSRSSSYLARNKRL